MTLEYLLGQSNFLDSLNQALARKGISGYYLTTDGINLILTDGTNNYELFTDSTEAPYIYKLRPSNDPAPEPVWDAIHALQTAVHELQVQFADFRSLPTPADPPDGRKFLSEDMTYKVPAGGGGGGTSDHSQLENRDLDDQHPISAITDLTEALSNANARADEAATSAATAATQATASAASAATAATQAGNSATSSTSASESAQASATSAATAAQASTASAESADAAKLSANEAELSATAAQEAAQSAMESISIATHYAFHKAQEKAGPGQTIVWDDEHYTWTRSSIDTGGLAGHILTVTIGPATGTVPTGKVVVNLKNLTYNYISTREFASWAEATANPVQFSLVDNQPYSLWLDGEDISTADTYNIATDTAVTHNPVFVVEQSIALMVAGPFYIETGYSDADTLDGFEYSWDFYADGVKFQTVAGVWSQAPVASRIEVPKLGLTKLDIKPTHGYSQGWAQGLRFYTRSISTFQGSVLSIDRLPMEAFLPHTGTRWKHTFYQFARGLSSLSSFPDLVFPGTYDPTTGLSLDMFSGGDLAIQQQPTIDISASYAAYPTRELSAPRFKNMQGLPFTYGKAALSKGGWDPSSMAEIFINTRYADEDGKRALWTDGTEMIPGQDGLPTTIYSAG